VKSSHVLCGIKLLFSQNAVKTYPIEITGQFPLGLIDFIDTTIYIDILFPDKVSMFQPSIDFLIFNFFNFF